MRVLIADDHEVVRRGLKDILTESFSDLEIGEAGDAKEILALFHAQPWDVVLLDINMPGRSGLEVLEDLKRLNPSTPVLILSMHPERDYALRTFKLGASGYVSKQSASDELIRAVNKVIGGGRYVTPAVAEKLAAAFSDEAPVAPHQLLSSRELQVLCLIASGRTLKEIAADLGLSEKTIGTYRSRISAKMGLSTNVELTRYALQNRLVD